MFVCIVVSYLSCGSVAVIYDSIAMATHIAPHANANVPVECTHINPAVTLVPICNAVASFIMFMVVSYLVGAADFHG